MNNLHLYPTINESTAKKYGIEVEEIKYSYGDDSLTFNERGVLQNTNDRLWNAQDKGLRIRTSIRINPSLIYGKGGVLCANAQIGFYISWSNATTMQSGCIMPLHSASSYFEFEYTFESEEITGTLTLDIHAYVMEPAPEVSEDEQYLMNDKGVSIGIVKSDEVLLSDDHHHFPIIKVAADDKPIWWVSLEWDDPEVDRFDNYVTVYLNKKHKSYPKSEKDSEFLCSIIATVYLLIIKKLKAQTKNEDLIHKTYYGSDEFEEYSVCKVMNFFFSSMNYLQYDTVSAASDEVLLLELQREISLMYGGSNQ